MIHHRGSADKSTCSMMEQMYRQELAKSEEIEKVVLSIFFKSLNERNIFSLRHVRSLGQNWINNIKLG